MPRHSFYGPLFLILGTVKKRTWSCSETGPGAGQFKFRMFLQYAWAMRKTTNCRKRKAQPDGQAEHYTSPWGGTQEGEKGGGAAARAAPRTLPFCPRAPNETSRRYVGTVSRRGAVSSWRRLRRVRRSHAPWLRRARRSGGSSGARARF